jgi:hypothetical protein
MKDIEFKKMIGHRMVDSDGFTYVYGAAKDGSTNRSSNRPSTKRSIRAHKRGVKAAAFRREVADAS